CHSPRAGRHPSRRRACGSPEPDSAAGPEGTMITSVYVQSSRCIKRLTLALSPLTVLVGQNASGKSALLSAMLGDLGSPWLYGSLPQDLRLWTDGAPSVVQNAAQHQQQRSQLLHLDPQQLRSTNVAEHAARLEPSGRNLTNVFAGLGRAQQVE